VPPPQAVVLLPFIDESRLLEVEGELTEDLSPEERRRNVVRHTSHLFVAPDHPLSIALGPEAPGCALWTPQRWGTLCGIFCML